MESQRALAGGLLPAGAILELPFLERQLLAAVYRSARAIASRNCVAVLTVTVAPPAPPLVPF